MHHYTWIFLWQTFSHRFKFLFTTESLKMVHHAAHFILDRAGNHLAAWFQVRSWEVLWAVHTRGAPQCLHLTRPVPCSTQTSRHNTDGGSVTAVRSSRQGRRVLSVSIGGQSCQWLDGGLTKSAFILHQGLMHKVILFVCLNHAASETTQAQNHTTHASQPCRLWNNTGLKSYHSRVSTMSPLKQHRPKIIPLMRLNHATAETLYLQAQNHTVCMSEWCYLRNNKRAKLGFNAQSTMTVICWWTETTQKRNLVLMPDQPWHLYPCEQKQHRKEIWF